MKRTTLLTVASIACLAGLGCGKVGALPFWWPGLILLTYWSRQRLLIFVAAGILLGWWRGAVFVRQLDPYKRLYGHSVVVRVTAKTDGVYAASRNLAFDGGQVEVVYPEARKLPGILKLETLGLPAVFRGDRLEISGKLYPAGGSRQGSIKFGQGRLLARSLGSLEKARLKFNASLQSVLPEPQASFGLGILIGQRSTLPASVGESLSAAGLTHIIAVSGYNLTIIIRYFGQRFGRSKYQTLVLSTGLIAVFILVTGFSASIVRAGIVSMLSLGAWYYGRTFKPLLVLTLTAAITALWYPVYVWSDVGWYLSFLAFFGVMILGPLIAACLWKTRPPGSLAAIAIESGCAQIMTTPYILYIFKTTSLVALPANMLVVPLVPLAMLVTAFGGMAGLALPELGPWLAWPARQLLGFMLQVAGWISRLPHAVIGYVLPFWLMLLVYGGIMALCWWLWVKTKPRYVKITDKGVDS